MFVYAEVERDHKIIQNMELLICKPKAITLMVKKCIQHNAVNI